MARAKRGRPARAAGEDRSGAWLAELSALGSDPSRWQSLDEDALQLIAFQQCLYFGATPDPEIGDSLGRLYAVLAGRVPVDARWELLDRVTGAVSEGSTSVVAMLPFLQHEPVAHVVEAASVSFASLMPLADDDPMTGPRAVLAMVEHAESDDVAVGLLSGLLTLGDRRTLPLLDGCWRRLGLDARERLTHVRPAFAFASLAEFYMGWLEDADEGTFGAVAGALARMPEDGRGRVLDVERKFPENAADDRPEIAVLGEWSVAEFGARIAPRLADLARRENEPRVLPGVMHAWQIAEPPAGPGVAGEAH